MLDGSPAAGADAAGRGLTEGVRRQPDGGIENCCGGSVEAGCVRGDFEYRDAVIGLRHDDEDVGDLAVQYVVRVARQPVVRVVLNCLNRNTVRCPRATGSGSRDGSDRGSRRQSREQPGLVIVSAGSLNQCRGENRAGQERGGQQGRTGDLGDRLQLLRPQPDAAVFGVDDQTCHALRGQLVPEVAIEAVVGAHDPAHVGFGAMLTEQVFHGCGEFGAFGHAHRHVVTLLHVRSMQRGRRRPVNRIVRHLHVSIGDICGTRRRLHVPNAHVRVSVLVVYSAGPMPPRWTYAS